MIGYPTPSLENCVGLLLVLLKSHAKFQTPRIILSVEVEFVVMRCEWYEQQSYHHVISG